MAEPGVGRQAPEVRSRPSGGGPTGRWSSGAHLRGFDLGCSLESVLSGEP